MLRNSRRLRFAAWPTRAEEDDVAIEAAIF
jgi:hypothetical protein